MLRYCLLPWYTIVLRVTADCTHRLWPSWYSHLTSDMHQIDLEFFNKWEGGMEGPLKEHVGFQWSAVSHLGYFGKVGMWLYHLKRIKILVQLSNLNCRPWSMSRCGFMLPKTRLFLSLMWCDWATTKFWKRENSQRNLLAESQILSRKDEIKRAGDCCVLVAWSSLKECSLNATDFQ